MTPNLRMRGHAPLELELKSAGSNLPSTADGAVGRRKRFRIASAIPEYVARFDRPIPRQRLID